jgi:DNA-binding response OmpR family regulator
MLSKKLTTVRFIVKILIADDNPVFRSVLRVMLTKWGYSVVTACDGEEAWQTLRADDGPRLAILDWIMPGMEGIEVCRLARAAFGRDVYILILTARTESEDLEAAVEAGADDYVSKPFKSQELSARLRTGCRILDLQDSLAVARECACKNLTLSVFGQRIADENAGVWDRSVGCAHETAQS